MKYKLIAIVLFAAFLVGCQTPQPTPTPPPPPPPSDPCPLPTGYRVDEAAIQVAKMTLMNCPNKLDAVFHALLDMGKHSPSDQNRVLIRDLLMDMANQSRISELYSKSLYKKYFSTKFDSLPDIKVITLPRQMDSVKSALFEELRLKKEAMVDCCGERELYKAAEAEYSRLLLLLECLVLNEEY